MTLAAFGAVIVGTRSVYWGDQGFQAIPLLAFQQRWLDQGVVPLWNPHYFCGVPFVGNPQAWPLHPSSLLLYLFPAHHASGLMGVLSLLFASVGMLLFLRRRGLSVTASCLGAVAWAFGGALVSKVQFPNMTQSAAYLPWLLWATDGALLRPTAGRAAVLGLLAGLSLLGAHPQMFLMQVYVCLFWAIFRLRSAKPWPPLLASLGGAFLIALALSAAQTIPAVELMRVSVRDALTLEQADRWVLPWQAALTAFVAPNFYGNPLTGDYVLKGNFWEPAAYIGLVPFALAVAQAARGWRRSPETLFWAVLAVAGVWLSLGKVAGLYTLAFRFLPGVSVFHDPARWLQVATFALAALAAIGLDGLAGTLGRPERRIGLAAAAVVLTVADLVPFSHGLVPTVESRGWDYVPPVVRRLQDLPSGRIAHLDRRYAWQRFFAHRGYGPQTVENLHEFLETFGPNLPMYYGIDNALGYDPVRRRDVDRLLVGMAGQIEQAGVSGGRASLLRICGVTYVVTSRTSALAGANLSPPYAVAESRGIATRVQPVNPAGRRASLWHTWRTAPTASEALDRILAGDNEGAPIVAVSAPAFDLPDISSPQWPVETVSEEPDRVALRLPPGAGGGLVLLSDTLHPGWHATIDGTLASIYPANGVFRGVFVGARAREVVFTYRPASFTIGLFVSLAALCILAAIASCRVAATLTGTGQAR